MGCICLMGLKGQNGYLIPFPINLWLEHVHVALVATIHMFGTYSCDISV